MPDAAKPPHLTSHNAAAFQLSGVVESYHLRTPYPSALARCLQQLMTPAGGRVVELGCGTGELARMIAPYSERVDAIDISAGMLDRARAMPGADHPAIRWIHGAAEDAALDPPYALAIAGDSLHWMDWEIVLPGLSSALGAGAPLAIVSAIADTPPWSSELTAIIRRYSVMQDFTRYELVDELARRHLFEPLGDDTIGPEPFDRTVDEYIEALHATAGLPRERMGEDNARAFGAEVGRIIQPFADAGILHLNASACVAWGSPLGPGSQNGGIVDRRRE